MSDNKARVWFHPRAKSAGCPAGWTVSRRADLPDGDFGITEYAWGPVSLWFVDGDEFTDDERDAVYRSFVFGLRAVRQSVKG